MGSTNGPSRSRATGNTKTGGKTGAVKPTAPPAHHRAVRNNVRRRRCHHDHVCAWFCLHGHGRVSGVHSGNGDVRVSWMGAC